MQRLSISHHNIVSNIHDIVDWAQSDGRQFVLQPVRALFYVTVGNTYTSIALASLLVLNSNVDRQVMVIHLKLRTVRTMHLGFVAIALQPSVKITGNTPMAQTISTVCCDIHFNQPVTLQMVELCSRHTHNSILRENNDTIVRSTNANLILSTYHAIRLNTTKFGFLNNKLIVTII